MFLKKGCFGGVAVAFLFVSAAGLAADSESYLQRGHQYLTQKKFDQALKQFDAALQADPNSGEALFFQGVAYNRLGQFAKAAERLDQAKQFGTHPEWNFERGWAHLGQQEWDQAIDLLKAFDKKNPGRGQTYEFLGRAYVGLGKYEKGESYLNKAVEANPNLKATADTYLASIPKETKAEKEDKAWGVRTNFGGLYNSNAIALGNGRALPNDISRQNSFLGPVALNGSYRFKISDKSQLSLGHQVLSNVYEVSENLDMIDNYSVIGFRHRFDDKRALGISLSNDFTVIQTAKFRNQIGFQPVLGWRLNDWLVSELGYGFALGEYFFPSNANQNRDGNSHTAGITNYFAVPSTELNLRLGYSHLWNVADGLDFDYEANGLTFGASHPLFLGMTAEAFFNQAWNRYSNVNSLTAATRRSDNVTNLFGQINIPVYGDLKGYARFGYTRNSSNIGIFNYRAHQGGLGFLMGI